MAPIKQTFTGDASQLEKELQQLQKQVIKLREESAKTARDSVADTRSQERALKRFSETVKRDIATPMENYRQQVGRLREAHRAGMLTQEEYRRGVDKLKRDIREAADAEREAGKVRSTQAQGMGQAISSLARLAASYLTVSTAIAAINRELQLKAELEAAAKDTQVTVGDAQAQLRSNLGAFSAADRKRIIDDVQRVQDVTGFQDAAQLNLAAAAGISGGGTPDQVIDNLTQAALVSRQNPEQLATLVGAGIDVGKASGLDDARSNLGFILSAGAVSRPTNLRQQARNIPGAVIGAAGTDTTGDRQRAAREGAAAFAVLSNYGVDVEGQSSRTATISLATQLRDFFGAEGRDDPQTFGGRIRALQSDEELRTKFLADASFERQFKIPTEQLLTAGSDVARSFEQSFDSIQFDRSEFDALATDLGAQGITAEIRQGAAQRTAESITQQRELADTEGSRIAFARQRLEEGLTRGTAGTLAGGLQRTIEPYRFEAAINAGKSPEQAAIDILERMRDARNPGGFDEEDLSPSQRRSRAAFQQQIDILRAEAERRQEQENKVVDAINGLRDDIKQRGLPGQPVAVPQTEQHR